MKISLSRRIVVHMRGVEEQESQNLKCSESGEPAEKKHHADNDDTIQNRGHIQLRQLDY